MRSRVIADPAGANGDVPTGNHTMLQLVIDGLKMTPIDPTFTDARDAILDADCATNACANEDSIWNGFADRGLGYGASAPYFLVYNNVAGHVGIHESFSAPFLDVVDPGTDVAVDDSLGNSNGAIDPGEPADLTVTLTNPWRASRQGGDRRHGDPHHLDGRGHHHRRHRDLRRDRPDRQRRRRQLPDRARLRRRLRQLARLHRHHHLQPGHHRHQLQPPGRGPERDRPGRHLHPEPRTWRSRTGGAGRCSTS